MNGNAAAAEPKHLIGYFPSWGIHAQNYHVADVPADKLSHVVYAFADVTPTGDCVSTNVDDDRINFAQLQQLTQQHPNLRTLISVGGAKNSANFHAAIADPQIRVHFGQSCAQFMQTNGFDGIDIDWEYPGADDTQNFTVLLAELRRQLTALSGSGGSPYLLTIAAPAGAGNFSHVQLNLIHQDL